LSSINGLETAQPLTRYEDCLLLVGPKVTNGLVHAARKPSVNTWATAADFLVADAFAKRMLVEKLAKSWSLAPTDLVEPAIVDEEQVAMAEVRLNPC